MYECIEIYLHFRLKLSKQIRYEPVCVSANTSPGRQGSPHCVSIVSWTKTTLTIFLIKIPVLLSPCHVHMSLGVRFWTCSIATPKNK